MIMDDDNIDSSELLISHRSDLINSRHETEKKLKYATINLIESTMSLKKALVEVVSTGTQMDIL